MTQDPTNKIGKLLTRGMIGIVLFMIMVIAIDGCFYHKNQNSLKSSAITMFKNEIYMINEENANLKYENENLRNLVNILDTKLEIEQIRFTNLENKFKAVHVVNSDDVGPIYEDEEDGDNVLRVTAYAYVAEPRQTDSTPDINALGVKPKPGISIAVSRDLKNQLFGKLVYIENMGLRRVDDLMNVRHKNSIDLLMEDNKFAKNWGVKREIRVKILN